MTYQLSTATDSLRLSGKEFQMMEMLMVHPHQVISPEQFIAIAMISILLVLILIMACINLINYSHVVDNANWRLELLADNGGQFPMEDITDRNGGPPLPKNNLSGVDTFPRHHMSVETPFDSRYFVVTLDADNHILTTDTNHIAAISEEDAKSYALLLAQKNKTQGFLSYYRYTAVRQTTETGEDIVMYLFLDCQKDLSTFYNFLWASIGISVLGLVLVFSLVLFFSRLIVRPIAESYEKQKQFITNASHEIKTPLTIIDANTEVLEMEQGENEWTIRQLVSLLLDNAVKYSSEDGHSILFTVTL